ncbi:NUDIX hydrolase [Streptomyces sp. SL13]|uniref:NUDIX hydrolase n=1 Tax=Streptantibioticus silvisoli TaxID=2705255 RepID=A0AA90JWV5_9ACTN|nr:NUDIX hydrolase [Streptantibioticus silvisoli]MDI5963629.1 NUDIX hydrolase [Streptantibioticus silvisoli]MDI5969461.1 NUDIX hydrolase [Streptantibioticus silvisoli]
MTGPVPSKPLIRAAGAVLWRPAAASRDTGVEIALVHRPRYDDWSHPKGKLKRGEPDADAALREVREETGMDCVLGRPLPDIRYRVGDRWKLVRYWAARATGGEFTVNDEVDRLLWLDPADARAALTHPYDRPLVDAALASLSDLTGSTGFTGSTGPA